MAKEDIITGLDIGSTTIRVAVAQTGANGEVNIIGASEHPAEGISKGVITITLLAFHCINYFM